MITNYKDLTVWQKSMDLVTEVYELTKKLPLEERFGLCSQMRRCSVSIPSNIAEGRTRQSRKEYQRFISIALGSNAELQTQLLICERIKLLSKRDIQKAIDSSEEVGRMLFALYTRLSQT